MRVMQNNAKGHETWLRLACLAVSLGLHAGLGTVGWFGLQMATENTEPIIVALIERPTLPQPGASRPITAEPRRKSQEPAPSRRSSPVPVPAAVPAPAVVPQPEVPATAVADKSEEPVTSPAVILSSLPVGDGGAINVLSDNAAGGEGGSGYAGSGTGRGRSVGEGDDVAGLIKATPRYESIIQPYYPKLARQNRWEGTVRVRARVTADGKVESVALEASSGHAMLDRSAVDGVQYWRFIPATRNGIPVACDVSIPVSFKLTEQGEQ